MKQRYFLEIAFDGSQYFGWQIQPNHISVQERIQKVLSQLYATDISIVGCGRTDTGVHAKQYFLHFDAPVERKNIKDSLTIMFPQDISLLAVHKVDSKAHARYDATERSYTYYLHHKKDIFNRHYSLATDLKALDLTEVNKACQVFIEQTNYLPLCKKNPNIDKYTSEVQIARFEVSEDKQTAVFTVKANRFLHNQIRRMVGVLLNIGHGKASVAELEQAMKEDLILRLNDTVSSHALFLHSIKYPYI